MELQEGENTMKKVWMVSLVMLVGVAFPGLSLGAHVYQVGDTWSASADWTAQINPDDDSYGTAGVWSYGRDSGDLTNITLLDNWYGASSYPRWNSSVDVQCEVSQTYQHPGVANSSDRIWTSPISGSVHITGTASTPWGSNDGAYAKIYLLKAVTNEVALLQASTLLTANSPYAFNVDTSVASGDKIIFQVSKNGNNWTDHTFWNPVVTAVSVPEPVTIAMLSVGGLFAMMRRRK